jgi:hypothetical protein
MPATSGSLLNTNPKTDFVYIRKNPFDPLPLLSGCICSVVFEDIKMETLKA